MSNKTKETALLPRLEAWEAANGDADPMPYRLDAIGSDHDVIVAWVADKKTAEAIERAYNGYADLSRRHAEAVNALAHFREWHANNFGDFSADVNAQLLCLDNEAETVLSANPLL